MVLKSRCKSILVLGLCVVSCLGLSACKETLLGEAAVVVPEKMEVRNSTARASRPIGSLKRGDSVTIVERTSTPDGTYVRVQGPEGMDGWAAANNIVLQVNLNKANEIAATISGIGVQAECRSSAAIKVRLTPDRATDENVLVLLPAGSTFDIYDRETRQKAVDPKAAEKETPTPAKTGKAGAGSGSAGANYEIWYKVKPKDNPLIPGGYIYGGSVELTVPQEILYYMHPDRKIVGWQRLGTVKDDRGQENYHYVIFQKAYNQPDEKSDFDYFQIVGYDAKSRSMSYYNVMRKEIRGTFPVNVQLADKRATFSFKALDSSNAEVVTEFELHIDEKGRVRAQPDQTVAAKK